MHGLPGEVGRLFAAGKTSPAAAASLEDIDWGGIDTLMQLVDPPPAQVTAPPEMVRPSATAGSMSAAATLRMDVPDPALSIVREADPTGAAENPRLPGAYEAASQPLPRQSSSAAVRAETGAAALPPAADPWRIGPPGMGGGPRPVAFAPRSAPPGPRSQVVYTQAIRTPIMSTGAPPRWQGAETPGFGRAASGAIEFPFSHRVAIALRFRTDDALMEAEYALRTGGASALGWSASRVWAVLADLYLLKTTFQLEAAAAAAMVDVDWSALEALARFLEVPPPSP